MALALAFVLMVLGAGFGVLRVLGSSKGALQIGLAPAAGLAVLAVVATWSLGLGWPPPLAGLLVLSIGLAGLLSMASDGPLAAGLALATLVRQHRLASALLGAALLVPVIVLGAATAGVQVPLSPHDGAEHTQAIQAHRLGQPWPMWYPPGPSSLFGATLQVVPASLDSAAGALALGLALPPLAVLAVFGLGVAVWRDLRMASASALFISLTYLYPSFPQLWSGWPLSLSLVLVMGMWSVALEYVREPAWRWTLLAGLLLGAIVLVHGSEVYTLGLLLPMLLVAHWRRIEWRRLLGAVPLALVLGVVCAAPYLPGLLHWAGTGGAYAVGVEDAQVPQSGASVSAGPQPLVVFALDALGVDLPIRAALVLAGAAWAVRHGIGRSVIAVGALFAALAAIFSLLIGLPAVRELYALVFPWAMHYRLLMLVALAQALLAGAGVVSAAAAVDRWLRRQTHWPLRARRLVRRGGRLLAITWLVLATWSMLLIVAYPASVVVGYTDDDAAAMRWLRQNAAPGTLLANDGFADAGIWAPYKAGLPVLIERSMPGAETAARQLVLDNVAHLERVPEAVCALHVGYVYYGARSSQWDARRFPPLAELEVSPALAELFRSGDAAVFGVRLRCP
jgi:hypothetical protein